ncbi:MAG: metallophosphoesterase family protein [bacterium]
MRQDATGTPLAVLGAVVALTAGTCGAGEQGVQPFRFVVFGGVRGRVKVFRALAEQMARLRPEMVLSTGELVSKRGDRKTWTAFDEAMERFGEGCRAHGCVWQREPGQTFRRRLGPPPGATRRSDYYSFDHKGVHFVFLDSLRRARRDDEQTAWLDKDLAAAGQRPSVVVLHSPVLSPKGGTGNSGLARFYWRPLFVKHGVRLVLSGSPRFYHRTRQDGVVYIVTAGGGGILSRVESRRSLLPGDVLAAYHHFIAFTVTAGEFRGRVVDPEGRTRDEFVIPLRQPSDS